MFAWFLIVTEDQGTITEVFNFLNPELTPLVVWAIIILYMIIPHKRKFQEEGRYFFLKVLWLIFYGSFKGISFLVSNIEFTLT